MTHASENTELSQLQRRLHDAHENSSLLRDTIARLENDIERLTDENLDLKREIGMKSEPAEYGC